MCRKTKEFLKHNNIECEIIEVEKHNSRISFPTVIIGDEVIIDFDGEKLKKALKQI